MDKNFFSSILTPTLLSINIASTLLWGLYHEVVKKIPVNLSLYAILSTALH